jgi:hypothetical protein
MIREDSEEEREQRRDGIEEMERDEETTGPSLGIYSARVSQGLKAKPLLPG